MIKLPESLLHRRGLPYSQGDNLSPGWQCLIQVAWFLSIIDIVLEQQVPILDPGHSSDFITHYESINKTHNWHVYLGFQFLASSFWPPLQTEQMDQKDFPRTAGLWSPEQLCRLNEAYHPSFANQIPGYYKFAKLGDWLFMEPEISVLFPNS